MNANVELDYFLFKRITFLTIIFQWKFNLKGEF